jgi:hypothetical protein
MLKHVNRAASLRDQEILSTPPSTPPLSHPGRINEGPDFIFNNRRRMAGMRFTQAEPHLHGIET